MDNKTQPVTRVDIEAAASLIAGGVRRTPMLDGGAEFFGTSGQVVNKLELLQHTGSFKPRGALHRALTSDVPDSGLIAASGGNHGLAVAWVAQRLGVPGEIFVPEVSPPAKVDKIRKLGATVHVTGALYDDALAACRTRQLETGALDIHAYDTTAPSQVLAPSGSKSKKIFPTLTRCWCRLAAGDCRRGLPHGSTAPGPRSLWSSPKRRVVFQPRCRPVNQST